MPDGEAEQALMGVIHDEIGKVFSEVLENCGVFKDTEDGREGFLQFAGSVK